MPESKKVMLLLGILLECLAGDKLILHDEKVDFFKRRCNFLSRVYNFGKK